MTIEILVGMIASGKSTYARKRADEGALVISHDALTRMLHGGAYRYDPELRQCYRDMEDDLADNALSFERDVVIDRTHLTKESRRRWISFMPRYGFDLIPIIAVTFPIGAPSLHAYRRYIEDGRGRSYEDWLSVAQHHHSQAMAEPLTADEGFSEIREAPHLSPA